MAPINGFPFLDYLIDSVIQAGIQKILILLGYKADLIVDRYKGIKNINIQFSYGAIEDKTGRRLLNAYDQLDNHFLLMYGDNYWPIELNEMWTNYQNLNTPVTTTVFSNKNGTGEYGFENNVVMSEKSYVLMYDKKRKTNAANGVDIGYFLVAKDSLNPHISENISFEEHILPQFIAKNELGTYLTNNQYYYITNMKSLKAFERASLSNNFRPLSQKHFGV